MRLPRLYLPKGQQGEILDRYEVYNSVEVVAPGIELEEYRGTTKDQGPGKVIFLSAHSSFVNTSVNIQLLHRDVFPLSILL